MIPFTFKVNNQVQVSGIIEEVGVFEVLECLTTIGIKTVIILSYTLKRSILDFLLPF